MSLSSEALVAVTGIFPEKAITRGDGLAARALVGEWRTQVKRFFDQEEPARFTLYPRPAHRPTLDKLVEGVDPFAITGGLGDPELVEEYLATLNNAREYIRARWPSLSLGGYMGPQLLEPGWSAMADVWAVLAVVDDPSRLLEEILAHTVLDEQIQAVKTCYPELFKMLLAMFDERKQLVLTRNKSAQLPAAKETVVRALMGIPPDVSLEEAPQPPARVASSKDIKIDFSSAQTRAERISAK